MSENGKGDTPRPLSVDSTTYKNNWERIFGSKDTTCEYSGLPSTQSYEEPLPEAMQQKIDGIADKLEQLHKEILNASE